MKHDINCIKDLLLLLIRYKNEYHSSIPLWLLIDCPSVNSYSCEQQWYSLCFLIKIKCVTKIHDSYMVTQKGICFYKSL